MNRNVPPQAQYNSWNAARTNERTAERPPPRAHQYRRLNIIHPR